MKKILLILMLLLVISSSTIWASETKDSLTTSHPLGMHPKVPIRINNECDVQHCTEGFNIEGTTYVPIRVVLETMGATLRWDEQSSSVWIQTNGLKQTEVSKLDSIGEGKQKHDKQLFEQDTEKIIQRIQLAQNILVLYDHQIELAKTYYDETNEGIRIQAINNKLAETRKEHEKLLRIFIEYKDKYTEYASETERVLSMINWLNEILEEYQVAVQILQNYMDNHSEQYMKLYLIRRMNALDRIEKLERNIGNYIIKE